MPDIVIAGATYPDVPQIDVPKAGGGTASFYANGAGTLITKTITENGTYSAEDDDADGYSSVTVNVSGDAAINALLQNEFDVNFVSSATSVNVLAFYQNTRIKSVSMQNATYIKDNAFRSASNLETVSFPSVTSTGQNIFNGCSKITTPLAFPSLGVVAANAFSTIANCPCIDIGQSGMLNGGCFAGCGSLAILVFRSTNIKALGSTNVFNNTPFKSGGTGGTIYIPKVLYDHLGDGTENDYQSASNWSTIYGYGTITWAKIEGSYYETHYADGTVIS